MANVSGEPAGERNGRSIVVAVLDVVAELGSGRLVAVSAALTAVVCLGDFVTGPDVSFSIFYLLPVFLAASANDRLTGVLAAGLGAACWLLADAASRDGRSIAILVPVWNATVRFFMFWLVAALVGSLRNLVVQERTLARTDPLSGLANSRGFFDAVTRELARSHRSRAPITVAYIDVDDFKTVNDSLGHAEGDQVIMRVGEVIRSGTRTTDITGRVGGDEFAIVLPDTDSEGAREAVGGLHAKLVEMARVQRWPIGFSVGVMTFSLPPKSADELVARADALMYEVKRSGKRAARFESDGRGGRSLEAVG